MRYPKNLFLALAPLLVTNLWVARSAASSALPDVFDPGDLLWECSLGTHQYTVPRIDDGQLFIGIDDSAIDHPIIESTGGGLLMRLDLATGEMIWQLAVPRYMEGTEAPYHFNHWKCGICSQPAIDGKRLYIVGSRGEIMCLDRNGQADGNDKPFIDETAYLGIPADSEYKLTAKDGDIIWKYDLIKNLGVVPHDVCGSSPVLHGPYLYTSTSNGFDDKHVQPANPLAPSLIAFDKITGRLVAVDGELIGKRMFHGQWSSPIVTDAGGRYMVIFGGGDGFLYAFEPVDPTRVTDEPLTLNRIWQYDCNPPHYRYRDGKPVNYSRWNRQHADGPSEIIATPVAHNGRIYVAIGQSPLHGPGIGNLSCIDAATGKKVWDSQEVGRSLATVAIADGLLYTADYNGYCYCFDADSGRLFWKHDIEGGNWSASPVVVNGRVYFSNEKNVLWVLKHDRQKHVIARSRTRTPAITPVRYNSILLIPTQRNLFALKLGY
jgi:outer membrane protein assembly factor BamB